MRCFVKNKSRTFASLGKPGPLKITAENHGGKSQPAADAGLVRAIGLAEFAREIGFLAAYHAIADDEIEGRQQDEHPETVEAQGESRLADEHA